MALTELDGSVIASMFIRITDNNYNIPNIIINNPVNQRYAFGTAAGQADIVYSAELTIAPSATTSLVLNSGILEDLFGTGLKFANIKSIRIQHKSNSPASDINLTGNFLTTNFGAGFSIAYPQGGYFDISEANSGFGVVESTGNIIDLVNNDITNTAIVSVELLGIKDISPYIISVKTDNTGTSNNDQFTSPFPTNGPCDLTINYNNGEQIDVFTDYSDHDLTFTFAGGAATYSIEYSGTDYPGWQFANGGDAEKLTLISDWGTFDFSVDLTFQGCSNLISTATDIPFISSSSLSAIFSGCTLFDGDVTNWPMDNVISLNSTFTGCAAFTGIGITTWNTENIESMLSTFNGCSLFNQPINVWIMSKVTIIQLMFSGASIFNQPLNLWDTANIESMSFTFSQANAFDQDISSWDISSLSNGSFLLFNAASWSKTNYDLLLIAWSAKPHLNNVTNFRCVAQFSAGVAAAAKAVLEGDGWTFVDGGEAP